MDLDEDVLSSDLLWDDATRSERTPGDSFWSKLATSRYEDTYNTDSLLHSHDPLLTSAVVTAGDEAEQVNDLLFDELERIIISNPSPSSHLDLGLVSLYLYPYLHLKYTVCCIHYFPSSGLSSEEQSVRSSCLTPHLNAHSLTFNALFATCPSFARLQGAFRLFYASFLIPGLCLLLLS